MKKKNLQVVTLIKLILFIPIISVYSQVFNPPRENQEIFLTEEDSKYLSNLFPKMNIQKAPEVTLDQIIDSKIFELANYGENFKYSNDILKGHYYVRRDKNKFTIFILKNSHTNNNSNSFQTADYSVPESYIKAKLEFQLNEVDGNKYTELINETNLFEIDEKDSYTNSSTDEIVNYVYSSKIIIDQEALNFSPTQQYGKIANKSKSEQFLRDDLGNPSSVFCSPTDGIILPHFSEAWNGLGMTVDECWNRVVQSDKKYVQRVESFGSLGSGNWQFSSPTGIEYSPFYYPTYNGCWQYKNYPVYIADKGNSRIIKFIYRIGYCPSPHPIWYLAPPQEWQVLRNNLFYPHDLAFHPGADINNLSDDVLWYSESPGQNSLGSSIVAVNGVTGNEIQRISQINFGYGLENIYPSRLSIYRSPNSQKNILTFVDVNKNVLVFIKLTSNGTINTNSSYVFSKISLQGQILNSVLLNSYNNGVNENETTVWAVSDGGPGGCEYQNHCGTIHTLKVKYISNSPIGVEYLSSTWIGANSDKSFQNLNNLHMQNGFVDLFTLEKWDNNYGVRWYKPGIDTVSCQATDYCRDRDNMSLTIRTTNPSKILFENAEYGNGVTWVVKPGMQVSGLTIIDDEYYIPSGTTGLNILIPGLPYVGGDEAIHYVKIKFAICPQDEDIYISNHKISKTFIVLMKNCNIIGGGCPFVFVDKGNEFLQDNNILHRSEFEENVGKDIEDKYLLGVTPTFNQSDSTCNLKIRELNNDISHFDKFSLAAIDHPIGTSLGITENNDYVLYFPQITQSPVHAEHNGDDVTRVLGYDSNSTKTVKGSEDDDVNGTFRFDHDRTELKQNMENILLNSLKGLNSSIKIKNRNKRNTNVNRDFGFDDSVAILLDPSESDRWYVPVNKDQAGVISAFDKSQSEPVEKPFAKRQNTSPVLITVGKHVNIDSISSIWNSEFMISYLAVTPVYYGGYIENILQLVESNDSLYGDVLPLLLDVDQNYAKMDSTTNITLKFKNTFGNVQSGFIRDYVLITDGRYEKVAEGDNILNSNDRDENLSIPIEYKLYQNYPNPFNPTTTIKFDLPKEGLVTIKIYDVLGKEVYSFKELRSGGFHQINFDGSNYSSGVYFYRIETENFIQTKRMLLLK